jgi:hypothetical protein
VVLALSERVLASADLVSRAVTISQVTGVDPRCTVEVQADAAFLGTLAHACAALDPATSISISLAPALSSATGKAIVPLNVTFAPHDAVDMAGCLVLRLYQGASASLPRRPRCASLAATFTSLIGAE